MITKIVVGVSLRGRRLKRRVTEETWGSGEHDAIVGEAVACLVSEIVAVM